MTTTTTPTQSTTNSSLKMNLDWYENGRFVPHLDRRAITPGEKTMLENWLSDIAGRVDKLQDELGVSPTELTEDLATLTLQHKFSTTSYCVPSLVSVVHKFAACSQKGEGVTLRNEKYPEHTLS